MERFTEAAREFVRQLKDARDSGFGFVPLVGAGLSAPSGVPIIREVLDYLRRCVAMALGLDNPASWNPDCAVARHDVCSMQFHRHRRWLPGRDEWPPFGDPQIYQRDTVNWESRLEQVVGEMRRLARREGYTEYPELDIFQEAFGAEAEWRSLLLFLSRLRLKHDSGASGPPSHQLTLGPPDLDIVDTFFLNVVDNKQPTLGHRMLARLAGPLRIDTALTTNFDDLLEQAFSETGNHFTVFDVHMESGLPPYRNMHHKNSIVKLHGGRYGLRADYSLDRPPSDDDLRHFTSYLAAHHIDDKTWRARAPQHIQARRHIIVCGLSGADTRIAIMIKEAVHRLRGIKVFWIGFSKRDEETAHGLLEDAFEVQLMEQGWRKGECGWSRENEAVPKGETPGDRARRAVAFVETRDKFFHVVRHHFPGLLFLRAYQGLTRSLPPTKSIFPSSPRLPVPPELVATDADGLDALTGQRKNERGTVDGAPTRQTYCQQIQERLNDCITKSAHKPETKRVVLMHGKRGEFLGASTAAARAFGKELDRGRQCVWIDLDEVGSCNDLFEVIIHTIARKAGVTDWMPVLLQIDSSNVNNARIEDAQLNEIARLTNNPNRDWVIFLNGRCGAGATFVHTDKYEQFRKKYPNGWLDNDGYITNVGFHVDDPTCNADSVISLLSRMCGKDCPNVSTVFLCYDGDFQIAVRDQLPTISEPIQIAENELNVKSANQIVENAIGWIEERGDQEQMRRRFLYTLVLTNRVRYPAALWTWPFHWNDNTMAQRVKNTDEWTTDLEKRHVIRRKRGGFIWLHCDIRNQLRTKLQDHEDVKQLTASIHRGLAEFNHRLLLASDTPAPAFEVVYHRCKQVVAMLPDGSAENADNIVNALSDARRALLTARPNMLTQGFSKAVCRKLHQIRDEYLEEVERVVASWVKEDTQRAETGQRIRHRLQLIRECTLRMNRMVAREVGENVKGFERHRELRAWQWVQRAHTKLSHEEQKEKVAEKLSLFQPAFSLKTDGPDQAQRTKDRRDASRAILALGSNEPPAEWIDSCNELGTLALAARSFKYSRATFTRVLSQWEFPIEFLKAETPLHKNEQRQEVWNWLHKTLPKLSSRFTRLQENSSVHRECTFEVLRQFTKTFQRIVQLQVVRGHVILTVERRKLINSNSFEKSATCFRKARRAAEIGRMVHDLLNRDDLRFAVSREPRIIPNEDLSRWHDDRQRMETLQSLALAFTSDFETALRRLNEAEATLNEAKHDEHAMEKAIIDLHRAEVITQQAMHDTDSVNESDARKPSLLDDLRGQILNSVHKEATNANSGQRSALTGLLENLTVWINRRLDSDRESFHRKLRESLSSIDDAWQTLSRAERLLKGHRKNVWWTTWFFELRLKAVELRLFVRLFEMLAAPEPEATPKRTEGSSRDGVNSMWLPHIGLEAAPHGTPTIADRLLDNAERMVRLDLYRVARTAESYANCTLVMAIWREALDQHGDGSDWSELGRRQVGMCKRLKAIRKSIKRRKSRRTELDLEWEKTQMDKHVKTYIKYVRAHTKQVRELAIQGLWPYGRDKR